MRAGPPLVLVAVLSGAAFGCVLGTEEPPGCQSDADCSAGFTCRAGACFGTTTPRSPPPDAGSDGDAGDDAG